MLWEGYYHHPQFTDEQTEIEFLSIRGWIRAHVLKVGTGTYLYTHLRGHDVTCGGKMVEATQASTDGWMDKPNAVGTFNDSMVFSHKKEGNADTCYNMDEPRRHYPITKGQILCVPTNTGYLE